MGKSLAQTARRCRRLGRTHLLHLPLPTHLHGARKGKLFFSERGQVNGRSSAADMVMMVNAASRKGVGDLVWLGYSPKSKTGKSWNAPRVKFGTQLNCINALAAEGIKMVMESKCWEPDHIDVWLLKWCLHWVALEHIAVSASRKRVPDELFGMRPTQLWAPGRART